MIDEQPPYVSERLDLIARLEQHGPNGLSDLDRKKAKDRTTLMIKLWKDAQDESLALRMQTLSTISITTKGKIEIHNPERLQSINERLDHLVNLAVTIEKAVEVLHKKAPGYLNVMMEGKDKAERTTREFQEGLNRVLGIELKDFGAPSVEEAMKSRRYLDFKKRAEKHEQHARKYIAETEPQIALIKEQLAAVEEALGYSISKVAITAKPNYGSAINREKAGGMA